MRSDAIAERSAAGHDKAHARARRVAADGGDEGFGQRDLILHLLHPAYGSDEPQIGPRERAIGDGQPSAGSGREARRIHAVVDLADPARRHADGSAQIVGEIPRQRDIAAHEWTIETPDPPVLAVGAVEIADVAAVLAMHAGRDPGEPGRDARFQRSQIAGVHDGRLEREE